MKRKLTSSCTRDFVEWMKHTYRPLPTSFTRHGPKQKVEIIFHAIETDKTTAIIISGELLAQLNECLSHCTTFDFIDEIKPKLPVKFFFQEIGSFMVQHTLVAWQTLVVALKLQRIRDFLISAMDSETKKIPGILGKNITEKQSPKSGSENLRHKLLCAFK